MNRRIAKKVSRRTMWPRTDKEKLARRIADRRLPIFQLRPHAEATDESREWLRKFNRSRECVRMGQEFTRMYTDYLLFGSMTLVTQAT